MTSTTDAAGVDHHVAQLTRLHLMALTQLREEYDEEVARHYEQGYRASHCIHGTRMVWSDDRDAICGPCEEGLSDEEVAERIAKDAVHEFKERMTLVQSARRLNAPTEIIDPLISWAVEPIKPPRIKYPLPEPCSCGWQYPEEVLEQAREGLVQLDTNPTHVCLP